MQETRRQILEVLLEHKQITVDEIVENLRVLRGDEITSVTIRHHLSRLQEEGLVSTPHMKYRSTPGRPQHIYELTHQGISFFPNNYEQMTGSLIEKMQQTLPSNTVNVIIEGIADDMAHEAHIPQGSIKDKLTAIVDYLNTKGYDAAWEVGQEGYMLHTCNCPYHSVASQNVSLCQLDMRLVSSMLGIVPRLQSRISEGAEKCSYLIPHRNSG